MKVLSIEESADLLYTQLLNELISNYDAYIEIKDSENIIINKSDITAALSLQASVTTIITLLIQFAFTADEVADEILQQLFSFHQSVVQKNTVIQIIHCHNITITLSHTSILSSVQLLFQALNTLLVATDIL
ncbi:spore coat protein [Bacillus sp. NPDC077027]|uniref:spore coat protein n=1 Tax=Bacillus sp. NPDC077027 TaxID=3390548 RepID=UPI003D026001